MLRSLIGNSFLISSSSHGSRFNQIRGMHSRNKQATEFIAKGWAALKEVDRVIDYCEINDRRLIPHLRTAKENFELALEADNSNTHVRYWLAKLHLKYHVPGACKPVGASLLVEAAEMGNADALFDLGCRLRVYDPMIHLLPLIAIISARLDIFLPDCQLARPQCLHLQNDYVQFDQQAFYYLEKAVEQLHPGALYLLGAVYLTGDCVKQDLASALWCFHRAAEKNGKMRRNKIYSNKFDMPKASFFKMCKRGDFRNCQGHAGAAIAYGSLLLKGVQVPESLTKFKEKR